ncbi:hypothetical protein GCM10010269_67180 [Streptomyces humidus]|uniref:Uncharacterized protein n=1 Tax=Streptomyces humidus TaxID=52259 RepID=A0A918G672_9ACTN|nr:hypothetical protein GCM10010269_67180 [Streptomyces humidus]
MCFYQNVTRWNAGNPNARYQDITSGYQSLSTAARGANYVYNSRNDDVAWLRYTWAGDTSTRKKYSPASRSPRPRPADRLAASRRTPQWFLLPPSEVMCDIPTAGNDRPIHCRATADPSRMAGHSVDRRPPVLLKPLGTGESP